MDVKKRRAIEKRLDFAEYFIRSVHFDLQHAELRCRELKWRLDMTTRPQDGDMIIPPPVMRRTMEHLRTRIGVALAVMEGYIDAAHVELTGARAQLFPRRRQTGCVGRRGAR